jgi:hypothetical protein
LAGPPRRPRDRRSRSSSTAAGRDVGGEGFRSGRTRAGPDRPAVRARPGDRPRAMSASATWMRAPCSALAPTSPSAGTSRGCAPRTRTSADCSQRRCGSRRRPAGWPRIVAATLATYPLVIAETDSSVVPGDGFAHLVGAQRLRPVRLGTWLRRHHQTVRDGHRAEPPGSATDVRGARNVPRPGVPVPAAPYPGRR